MKFRLFIAWRYLFSKKSQNVINIISLISVVGVVVSTTALVCVMSVFNGFVSEIEKSFSSFDSELQIKSAYGKVFDFSKIEESIKQNENIAAYSGILQDDALIVYYDNQTPFSLRGVDENYNKVLNMDSLIVSGKFRLYDLDFDASIVGIGLASKLNLGVDYVNGITIYVPQRSGKINIVRPDAAFKKGEIFVCGIFNSHQPEFDENTLIVPISFAQKMYEYDTLTYSALALRLKNSKNINKTQKELQETLGADFLVQNRFEQQKDYFKIIKIERLLVFLILVFMMFIAICNIISSLLMLLIEKKQDIITLKNLGMSNLHIRQIFVLESWLMSAIGAVIGVVVGLVICFLQYKFGFLKMQSYSYLVNYPVYVKLLDIVMIFATIGIMGFISAFVSIKIYFKSIKD